MGERSSLLKYQQDMSSPLLSDSYYDEPEVQEPSKSKDLKPPRSGFLSTISNITKCFIGAASFELPHAFEQAGVLGSIVGIVFLAIASSFSLQRLASCSHLLPKRENGQPLTYPAVGLGAFGWWGWFIAWFGVLAMTLGVCGSYFVFIASTMSSITNLSQTLWLIITLGTVCILSWLRYLSYLAFTSAFGILALVLAVVVTCIDASHVHTHKGLDDLPVWEWSTYPLFLGNAGFLYLISTAILPLAQNMDNTKEQKFDFLTEPSIHGEMVIAHTNNGKNNKLGKEFSNAFNSSVLFVTILNLVFGLYAWKQYGECHGDDDDDCIQSNVIDNLGNGKLALSVKILLSIDLLFTSLVFLFPVNEVLEQELLGSDLIAQLQSKSISPFGDLSNAIEWKRNGLRTILVLAVAGIAFLVPSFSLLTGLTGGFGNNILGFILPPLFYYKLQDNAGYWHENGKRVNLLEQACLVFVFFFGVAFLFLSTYSFVAAIAKTE